MRAAVVANGEVDPRDRAHVASADVVIAADGGSRHCLDWDIAPALIVGDLDSGVHIAGVPLSQHAPNKDETDLELALGEAIRRGAAEITVVGALGGERVDHAATNLLLLVSDRYAGLGLRLVHGATSVRAVRGPRSLVLEGRPGDLVSLLPVGGDASGIATDGLRYPLRDATLPLGTARGVSNVIDAAPARVGLASGALLVFELRRG